VGLSQERQSEGVMDDETGELIQEDDLTGAGRDEHEIEILG